MEEQLSQRPQKLPEEAPIEGGEISGLATSTSEPIEGGEVSGLDPSGLVEFHEVKHRAYTAQKLAYGLVLLLGVSWFLHYAAIFCFEWRGHPEAAENLSKAFSAWLPIISGLVGGAVTYYFTREK